MNDFTRLDSEEHRGLRLRDNLSYDEMKSLKNCRLIADEIFLAGSSFPLFFLKDEEQGRFLLSAIFVLQDGGNLFVDQDGWSAPYFPLNIKRLPLVSGKELGVLGKELGVLGKELGTAASHAHDIYINLANEQVSAASGMRLFHDDGSETDFLNGRRKILEGIVQGEEKTGSLIDSILKYDLMSPLTITLSTAGGTRLIKGIYGIDHEKMKYMDPKSTLGLIEEGVLENILMMKASYSQIGRLIWMENKKMWKENGNISGKIINYSISSGRSM